MGNKYISDDVAFSILSKLPLKSLKRFSCVKKSWSLLFQDSSFMVMFNNNLIYNNLGVSLLPLDLSENGLYSLFGEKFEYKIKLDLPNAFQIQEFDIFGFSSVNGILCLIESDYLLSQKVVLLNPTTKEFKIILPSFDVSSRIESAFYDDEWPGFYVHGFGYDHVKKDYKVIRLVEIPESNYIDILWEIYSLRNNCWSKLDFYIPASYSSRRDLHVCINGTCHWLCVPYKGRLCLVSFDLINEVVKTTRIPYMDKTFDHEGPGIQLIGLKRSIALISYHKSTTTFHLSILGEIGVKESWTKLFIVGPTPSVMYPIRMKKNADEKSNKLTWFDHFITHIFVKLEDKECELNSLVYYEKFFLPTGGMDQIVSRPPITKVYFRRRRKLYN